LHYNFPPFSVGEVKGLRAPSRREIGHGALAEKALTPVIPSNDEFNYTIRLVSEILESNGSSSMATVCASTLALLDAGVPIKDHIAGVAMGLVTKDNKNIILSDITGDEDHIGDMDFKVCGSESGISALQMDIKISNISKELFEKALSMAKTGRIKILDIMRTSIRKPREISKYAPKKYKIEINKKKIKDLIGPNGKNIKKIVSDSGVKIDINDDGQVVLFSKSEIDIKKAKQMIYDLVSDPEIGKNYKGTVKNILEFGAFIEIKPGCEGLCHISNIDNKRIQKVEDVLKVGEKVTVKIIGIDKFGRIKLSRKAVYDEKNKSD
jgi:polyribonucleotide nucleotidyltransferase